MYIEERLSTRVNRAYDTVVCGGGFAGISAALACARHGNRVLLIEKEFMLGGLGTAGLVTIFLPICDGCGRQVSFGIAEELLRLSMKYGAEGLYPDNWLDENGERGEGKKRFQVQYNPQLFAILAEKLLRESGVDILYGTYAVGVDAADGIIKHIITENKSGRVAYAVKNAVDATGDGDIAKLANAPTDTFKQGNVLASWYYSLGKNGYNLNTVGCADIPDADKDDERRAEDRAVRRFSGLNGEELSEQVCLSHQSVYRDFLNKRNDDEGYVPITIATIPQVRMTRKIIGNYVLSDKEEHKHFNDSVGMISNWKKCGPIYEVPYGTLYSKAVKNLICAGRCVSVTEAMWDIMRVIPCCCVTGQAAGVAAAMTDDFSALEIADLQKALQEDGVVLYESEI